MDTLPLEADHGRHIEYWSLCGVNLKHFGFVAVDMESVYMKFVDMKFVHMESVYMKSVHMKSVHMESVYMESVYPDFVQDDCGPRILCCCMVTVDTGYRSTPERWDCHTDVGHQV